MKRRFIRLAAVFLLLALPLQAFAAASMLFCGRVTHDTWLGHTAKALSGHDAGPSAPVADHNDRDDHDALSGHHHDGDHGQIKHLADSCSACSDCCCPTALPSADPPSGPLVGGPALLIPFGTQSIPDLAPDRLERPPRSTLA